MCCSDFWHETETYEEDYDYEEDDEEDDIDEDVTLRGRESRLYDPYDDRGGLLSFTDCNLPSYSTSLDFRNTIDLREIGVETKRDAVLDLKARQAAASAAFPLASSASSRLLQTTRLNIADGCGVSGGDRGGGGSKMASNGLDSGGGLLHQHYHRHHYHHPQQQHHQQQQRQQQQHQRGWSNSSDFNFRFTDKSRSAPSLASGFDESSSTYPSRRSPRNSDYYSGTSIGTVSSSSLFENYTRVASVPVDLNLCGKDDDEYNEDNEEETTITNDDADDDCCLTKIVAHEMADDSGVSAQSSIESSKSSETNDSSVSSSSSRRRRDEDEKLAGKALTSSVRTQSRPEVVEVNVEDAPTSSLLSKVGAEANDAAKMHLDRDRPIVGSTDEEEAEEEEDEDTIEDMSQSGVVTSPSRDPDPPRSTVKTQDGGHSVLEMAIAMENDIDAVVDEAIRQFKREVEEATGAGGKTAIQAMEAMQRLSSGQQRTNRRVKNNASYELAQQYEVDERNFLSTGRMTSCAEDDVESPPCSPGGSATGTRRRVLNNASYELAQQSDYIKILQSSNARPFQRMDACDERSEVPRPTIACGIKVADLVREMGREPNFDDDAATPREDCETVEPFTRQANEQDNLAGAFRREERHENHVSPQRSKNVERADIQQQDSMIGQIKKNSDLFSRYGESGSGSGTVGRVDADDDEIDYPCLETKPILNDIDNHDYPNDDNEKTMRTQVPNRDEDRNGDESRNETIKNAGKVDAPPISRGLSFLGDFYPEAKNKIIGDPERALDDSSSNDNDRMLDDAIETGDRIEREPAADRLWRVVVEKQQSSASASPASDRFDATERESDSGVQHEESTVSGRGSVVEASNDAEEEELEEEEEEAAKRRSKECAYVEIGKAGPNSSVRTVQARAVTRASPPRPANPERIGVGRSLERNSGDDVNRGGNALLAESVVARREDKDDLDGEEEDEEAEARSVVPTKTIETTTTPRKAKSSGTEMSATAAKRLAMASPPGPPRNNNDHTTMRNDLGPQKNVNAVSSSPVNERKKGGLGGFLQRFSRLRFSGRSKVPRSEVTKRNDCGTVVTGDQVNRKLMDEQPGTTRRKNEPDYIIIPLHGPEDERRGPDGGRDEGDGETRKPRRLSDLERSASCAR